MGTTTGPTGDLVEQIPPDPTDRSEVDGQGCEREQDGERARRAVERHGVEHGHHNDTGEGRSSAEDAAVECDPTKEPLTAGRSGVVHVAVTIRLARVAGHGYHLCDGACTDDAIGHIDGLIADAV